MDLSSEDISNDVQEFLRCCEALLGHAAGNRLSTNECKILFHYTEELEDALRIHCGESEK